MEKYFFRKNKIKKIIYPALFTAILAVAIFSRTVFAVWNGTFYRPGDTLNPECLPTDANCDVATGLSVAAGKTLTASNTLTLTATDGSTLAIGSGGTLGTNAYTSVAYAPLASPTFTGTVTIPTPFTLGAVSVTTTGTQLNYLNAATGTTGTTSTNLVFSTSPTLITPALGTPTALVLTNATGLPAASVLAGTFGTGAYTMDTSLTVPTIIGGTATTSDLNLKTTSGIGATGADMHFLVGNNGATEAMTILNNGNVGVGTVTPAGTLHVAGQCVTGDTRLRRRRKKKKNHHPVAGGATPPPQGGEDYEYDEVRVDEINAGDEILSLDEKTGKLEYQKVRQLADMGIKPIYKLTTASGKTIRTTGNHPYLAQMKSEMPRRKPKLGVFYDNSNMFYAQKQAGWKVDFGKLKGQLQISFDVKFINFYTAIPIETDPARESTLDFLKFINPYVNLKTKPLKYIKTPDGVERKGDMDVNIALDLTETLDNVDAVLVVSGDSDLLPLRLYVTGRDKKIAFAGFRRNMAWELTKFGKYLYIDQYDSSLSFGKKGQKTNSGPELGVTLLSLLYSTRPSLSRGGRWIKVKDLKQDQKIAIYDGKKAIWDDIVNIEKLPAEQVYDIEIENTHNFVGNDIVAHNTAIFGAGEGGTPTTTTIRGAAAAGTNIAGANLTLDASNGTGTGGSGALIFRTAPAGSTGAVANTLTERMRIDNAGNVGIGTAGPTAVLHLKAGTATASTAPLKFTSGTNLTTAEAGAMEYDGTSLFFSPSTTRLRSVLTDNSIPSNGMLAIGNGTNYTNATLTGTANQVTVTNGAGTITLSTPQSIATASTPQFARLGLGQAAHATDIFSLTSTDTTASSKALNIAHTGAITGTGYAGYFSKTGASTTNVGLYATASGATNNYAAIFESGNVGIGTTAPQAKLNVFTATGGTTLGSNLLGWFGTSANTVGELAQIGFGYNPGTKPAAIISGVIDTATFYTRMGISFATRDDLNDSAPTEKMRITSAGNVGIGTTAPTSLLALGGTAARTIQMERNTTAATAGQGLTLYSGGAIAGTADLAGGDLTLKSGTSTGIGTSALHFFTATAGVTGTVDNAPTEKMTILGSGNVGIGTTAPAGTLHVAGQCVVADTRLRRRRKKKGATGETEEDPEADTSHRYGAGYEYDEVMIKDVTVGDEIQSMDPLTGKLVWSQILGLMDMGIKEIYSLTTLSGRNIRTTENHPYFVRTKYPEKIKNENQKLYRFEVDQSIKIEQYSEDTIIALANNEQSTTVLVPRKTKQDLRSLGQKHNQSLTVRMIVFASAVVTAIQHTQATIHELLIDIEYTGYEDIISGIITDVFPHISVIFAEIGKKSPAHYAALGVHKKQKNATYVASLEDLEYITENALRVAAHPHIRRTIPNPQALLKGSIYESKKYVKRSAESALRATSLTSSLSSGRSSVDPQALLKDSIYHDDEFVKNGAWIITRDIKINSYIAVVHGDLVTWERVVAINRQNSERVYDIEIDGTHNFIGNDIVAHNTAIFGAGEGGTPTVTTIRGAAAAGTNIAGANLTLDASNGTGTGGSGAFIFRTAPAGSTGAVANTLTERMRIDNAGNVGIGTTSPTAVLHLKAGTATASTAPLKFTSGTNLTTAEAGAMEYDGTSLFFSPSTTRLRSVLTDNSIPSNGMLAIGNGTNYTNATLTGTANQITVTNGAGSITLSTPQSIATTSTPQFARLGLGQAAHATDILSITSTDTTASGKALNITHTGAITGTGYAGYFSKTGASTTNVGLYATASGATNNYAAIFESGNVGIGTTSPAVKLEVAQGTGAVGIRTVASTADGVNPTIQLQRSNGYSTGRIEWIDNSNAVNWRMSVNDDVTNAFAIKEGTTGASTRLFIQTGGNVGIGTTAPTSLLALGGTAARTIQMERNTTAATAGQGLTLYSGGAIAGTADLAGGDLTLKSGTSTGIGTSALHFFTATAGVTGTADNAPTEKMTILGNGNVGIGTTSPRSGGAGATLDIQNNLYLGQTGAQNPSINSNDSLFFNIDANNDNTTHNFIIANNGTGTTGTELFRVQENGNVGIGTTSPAAHLQIDGNISASAWTTTGIAFDSNAATYTDTSTAALGTVAVRTANSFGAPTFASTNAITVTNAFSLYVPKPIAGTNTTITRANSAYFEGNVGIGTTAPGAKLDVRNNIWIGSVDNAGATIAFRGASTNKNWSIGNQDNGAYLEFTPSTVGGGSVFTSPSMVIDNNGNVGIGTTSPTAVLHLKAGTATANTAPLKFTSGTLLTTAEAGAVEFLTDAYYGTITTGAARKTFAFLESPSFTTPTLGAATYTTLSGGNITDSGLTATRVTFAGTGGLLSDDADLTFATDTLTATKVLAPTSVSTPSLISTGAVGITPAAGTNLNVSLSTTGDFAVNTNQLYVDTSAGNVGVGTAEPSTKLHVFDTTSFTTLTGTGAGAAIIRGGNANGDYSILRFDGSSANLAKIGAKQTALGSYLSFGTSNSYVSGVTNEALVIDYTGSVGVGTTAPTSLLALGGTAARIIQMERNTTAATAGQGLTLYSGGAIAGTADLAGGDLTLKSGTSTGIGTSALHFFTATAGVTGIADNAPTEKMTILGNGNVGIGTTAPTTLLHVGLAGTTLGTIGVAGNTSGLVTIRPAAAAGTWTLTLPTAVGAAGQQLTDAAGDGITSWAAAGSSRELKDIIGEVTDPAEALTQILSTPIYQFHYKPGMGTGDSATTYVGVMADEASWAMHYNNSIVNPVNTLGYMILGMKATNKKIEDLNLNIDGVAGTITPLPGSASESFAAAFFGNIKNKIGEWLADAGNSITDVFAQTFHAKDKLCINSTCVTEAELKTLLQNAGAGNAIPTPPQPLPQGEGAVVEPPPSGEAGGGGNFTPLITTPPPSNVGAPPQQGGGTTTEPPPSGEAGGGKLAPVSDPVSAPAPMPEVAPVTADPAPAPAPVSTLEPAPGATPSP